MSQRVQGIIDAMRDDACRFDQGTISIDGLSFALKAKLALLDDAGADPSWVEKLRSLRNEIEVVNAFFIESGRPGLSSEERNQVNHILRDLHAALVKQ